MPFIPAVNCALIEIIGTQNSQRCEMTIGVRFPSLYIMSDLNDLSAAIDGWVNTDLLDLLASDVTYEGVNVRGLNSAEDLESFLSEPLPGGAATAALPANVAVCITKRTGYTGRSARGRMYVWGVPKAFQDDARHYSNTVNALYTAAFDNLLGVIAGAGWEAVVISYYTLGTPRVTAHITPITALEVRDNRLDSQRRRLGTS